MSDDFDAQARSVRDNHYLHWFVMLTAAGYGWQLYGFWAGAGVLLFLVVAISATNLFILAKFGSLRLVRINRWAWVIFAFVALALSVARICEVGKPC